MPPGPTSRSERQVAGAKQHGRNGAVQVVDASSRKSVAFWRRKLASTRHRIAGIAHVLLPRPRHQGRGAWATRDRVHVTPGHHRRQVFKGLAARSQMLEWLRGCGWPLIWKLEAGAQGVSSQEISLRGRLFAVITYLYISST